MNHVPDTAISTYEQTTSALYGSLFSAYDKARFEESVALFEARHRTWGIDLEWFRGKTCLDGGCGGGRYLVALAKLGAARVVGIDIGQDGVRVANERLKERGLASVAEARVASVLEIPFPDASFDYVVSSGVIHHTPDPKHAFQELNRVLRPGGKLFLSVYGAGGLKWATNDFFRFFLKRFVPFHVTETVFRVIGVPPNKRYNILDNLYVPYCFRFKEQEIRTWLTEAGYTNIRRLKFERYDYETLSSRLIHGEGWIQMYADKADV